MGRGAYRSGMEMNTLILTDGGRAEAGFAVAVDAGDCFVRAVAVATDAPYAEVYEAVAALSAETGGRRSARDGVSTKLARRFMESIGWAWTPTMTIGSGCTVHLDGAELPSGRLVARVSKHFTAVVDGVVHDNHDPRRIAIRCVDGVWGEPVATRCVYGYWSAA